ncbi:DUF4395 domain-containing protein [Brevibacterium sp. PAMC21349]|nr:DUF4395 domain-containing protein [Brevibacterium sp. PAMC21349]
MTSEIRSIPRPLVRTNQWVILLSVATALLTGQLWILAIPLTAGLLGLLFNFNPVMRLAKLFSLLRTWIHFFFAWLGCYRIYIHLDGRNGFTHSHSWILHRLLHPLSMEAIFLSPIYSLIPYTNGTDMHQSHYIIWLYVRNYSF